MGNIFSSLKAMLFIGIESSHIVVLNNATSSLLYYREAGVYSQR